VALVWSAIALGLIGGACVFMLWIWRAHFGAPPHRTLDAPATDATLATLRRLGFDDIRSRALFEAKTWSGSQSLERYDLEIELGDGPDRDYTRVLCSFKESLTQGIEILVEDRPSPARWLMRFAEAQLDDPHIDPKFLLLTRNQERLVAFMETPAREALLDLEEVCDDIRLTDNSVYAFYERLVTGRELEQVVETQRALAGLMIAFAETAGPIEENLPTSYSTMNSGYDRDDGPSVEDQIRSLDLVDPAALGGGEEE
jgi:hypothetical protein